jgi:hypothetical protein
MTGILNVLAGDNGTAAASYTGPGDIVSGALSWYGLRGYNAAYATGSNPCVDIKDSSVLNAATINILSNGNFDVATLNTWIGLHGTAYITKLYDQSGNGIHLTPTANPPTAPTIAVSPTGITSGLAVVFSNGFALTNGAAFTQAQPLSISSVVRGPASGSYSYLMQSTGNFSAGTVAGSNQVFIYAGSAVQTATASDDHFHAVQYLVNAGSTTINVDGSTTSPGSPGTTGISSSDLKVPGPSAGVYVAEFGVWSGSIASLIANQTSYWGPS